MLLSAQEYFIENGSVQSPLLGKNQSQIMKELLNYSEKNEFSDLIFKKNNGDFVYDINAVNGNGMTLLMELVTRETNDLIAAVLSRSDLDINYTCKRTGDTALHYAVQAHNQQAVALLLSDDRLDASIKNSDGKTAAWYAQGSIKDIFNDKGRALKVEKKLKCCIIT